MAISEPDTARYGAGEPPGSGDAVITRRVSWRRWLIAAIGLVLVAAVAVLGSLAIIEGITNTGPRPVTIEAVSVVAPGGQQLFPWPLTGAGPVKWALEEQQNPPLPRSVAACSYSTPCQVSDLSLAPQESVALAIPVRFADSCFISNGWTGTDYVYVEERFGPFTHWVKVQDGVPYIFHEPEPAGLGGSVCLAR